MECYAPETCKKYLTSACDINSCIRCKRIDILYNEALLSDNQKKNIKLYPSENDYEQFKRLSSIKYNIEDFVKNGNNLYIYSSTCGNGKTSWSIKLLQSYILKTWYKTLQCNALFINVPKFLLSLKSYITDKNNYIEHIKDNIEIADIVIWDDIATKSTTEFETENLLNYINMRLNLGKSNIYTSNINPEDLSNIVGDRLASRIINSELIPFNGEDKRMMEIIK